MKNGGQIPWDVTAVLQNIRDLLSDGKTPNERRFGVPFDRLYFPFGAMVEYHPISAKNLSRLHRFGPDVLPGVYLDYVLYSELHARRLNAKEVLTAAKK